MGRSRNYDSERALEYDPHDLKTTPIARCPCAHGAQRVPFEILMNGRMVNDWVCQSCHRGSSGRDYNPTQVRRSTPAPMYAVAEDWHFRHDDQGWLHIPHAQLAAQ